MVIEQPYDNPAEFHQVHLDAVVGATKAIYQSNGQQPVRILDLATGPNEFNPGYVRELRKKGIEYELVLSDISPTVFVIGYENIERECPEELANIKCVLADAKELRKDLTKIRVGEEGWKQLEEVLDDSRYQFLQSGYENGQRIVDFSDESFDLVMGIIPYGSISSEAGDYSTPISESARVLKQGGYHIMNEGPADGTLCLYLTHLFGKHNGKSDLTIRERILSAISGARTKHIDIIKNELDSILRPIAVHSAIFEQNNDRSILKRIFQNGDLKEFVFVHQK
ncbi:hypothetical protein ACFL0W_04040 [Nanoarchaeota archaeon]